MFKLLKDLTRAPEPLSRPAPGSGNAPTHPLHQPYAARQRIRSPRPGLPTASVSSETVSARRASVAKQLEPVKEEETVETDEDAVKTVELLKALEAAGQGDGGLMTYVEVGPSRKRIASQFIWARPYLGSTPYLDITSLVELSVDTEASKFSSQPCGLGFHGSLLPMRHRTRKHRSWRYRGWRV